MTAEASPENPSREVNNSTSSGLSWWPGVDWITGVGLDPNTAWSMSQWASEMLTVELRKGNIRKSWGMAGFNGIACGQVQYGERNDEVIVRLSSEAAACSWRKLYQLSSSVTRLDVQVTVWSKLRPRNVVRNCHRKALRRSASLKRGPSVRLITSNDGSDTVYLGSRLSDVFGRIYNKGAESKLKYYEGAVRYEVQFQRKLVNVAVRRLAAKQNERDGVTEQVSGFFEARGCRLGILGEGIVNRLPRSRTDTRRRLEWLGKAVRGSAQLLVSHGLGDEMLDQLGLYISADGKLEVLDHVGQHSN